VTIEVYPPSFNAEVVCLWQKINHLVDLLARAASVKKITFIYKPLHGRNWVSNGQGIDTIKSSSLEIPQLGRKPSENEYEMKSVRP
jgi:hypothetical protein